MAAVAVAAAAAATPVAAAGGMAVAPVLFMQNVRNGPSTDGDT